MPKQRTPKNLPESMEMVPAWIDDKTKDVGDRLKDFFTRHNNIRRKKKLWLDEVFQRDFAETGNPLAAWDAFLLARKMKEPIPGWVLEYLEMVADRLLRPNNTASRTAWCLGFQGGAGPGPWKQYLSYQVRRTAIAHMRRKAKTQPEKAIDDLCVEVVGEVKKRWGVTVEWDTIKRWYYEMTV